MFLTINEFVRNTSLWGKVQYGHTTKYLVETDCLRAKMANPIYYVCAGSCSTGKKDLDSPSMDEEQTSLQIVLQKMQKGNRTALTLCVF